MHVVLRERNRISGFFDRVLRRLGQVEPDAPIIAAVHPATHGDFDGAVAEFRHHDFRGRIGQNALVVRHQPGQDFHRAVNIVRIADAHRDIDAPRRVARIVRDRLVPERRIRHVHIKAVGGPHFRREQPHVDDRAGDPARVDVLVGLERPQQQQHQSGSDVLQRALQGQTDGEACRADHRDNAGGLHADPVQHRDQDERQNRVTHEIGEEPAQGSIDLGRSFQAAHRQISRPPGDDPTDDQNRDRGKDVEPENADRLHRLVVCGDNLLTHLAFSSVCRSEIQLRFMCPYGQRSPRRACRSRAAH